MAKRNRKKRTPPQDSAPVAAAARSRAGKPDWILPAAIAVLLAVLTFLFYAPSLGSDLVYDARLEILHEGFITNPANVADLLSLKVLSMRLMLSDRPGQLLYLMLIAGVSGKDPFGYHLASDLLHAANVALLFILLLRLARGPRAVSSPEEDRRTLLACAAVASIFALHPLAVEAAASVSYSSDLLITFFTLAALLAATAFRPEDARAAWRIGGLGALCAFAAVTCKESGLAACGALVVYWFLYRRSETRRPWFLFLGAAVASSVVFLAARFLLAPLLSSEQPIGYLGGSFAQVFLIQPCFWVFMMGKLLWPVHLSADYTLEDVAGLSTPLALIILAAVLALQLWLATRSRLGAMGVAIYWLGLATVSNFIPLDRPLADRFYYLPLTGVAAQLLALLLMTIKSRAGFFAAITACFVALVPLAVLSWERQGVFASESNLWTDTVQASPASATARLNLGTVLVEKGQIEQAMVLFQKAVELDARNAQARDDLGHALLEEGHVDESIPQFQKALELYPNYEEAESNLGNAFTQKGDLNEAALHFQKAVEIAPVLALPHYDLGNTFLKLGRLDDAVAQYQKTLDLDPSYASAANNLGSILLQKGQVDQAITDFMRALAIDPNSAHAHTNLGHALLQKGRADEAIAQFQAVLRLDPNNADAQQSLIRAQQMTSQAPQAR